MNGKCKIKEFTMFNLNSFDISCNLCFGANTKFEYKITGNKVVLIKKGMDLEIPIDEFENRFTVIEETKGE